MDRKRKAKRGKESKGRRLGSQVQESEEEAILLGPDRSVNYCAAQKCWPHTSPQNFLIMYYIILFVFLYWDEYFRQRRDMGVN